MTANSTKTKSKSISRLFRLYDYLLYTLPVVLFFSYYPVIHLGSDAAMNFELSLPLLWLVVFDVVALIGLYLIGRQVERPAKPGTRSAKPSMRTTESTARVDGSSAKSSAWHHNFPGISDRKIFLLSLLPFYATLSVFWSANPVRAILTAGILWAVFFAVFAILFVTPLVPRPESRSRTFYGNILRSLLLSSTIVCGVCWVQCLLDVFGVSSSYTLLCRGCVSGTFGFPHPSGFAIEPQFMGNLLLAPTLVTFFLLIFRREKLSSRAQKILFALAAFFSATLFLTFSRGAIYAFAVALAVLLIWAYVQQRTNSAQPVQLVHLQFRYVVLPIATFVFVLIMQGIFCILGPTSEGFVSGVTKSLHHLTLGVVDLRPSQPASTQVNTANTQVDAADPQTGNDADSATGTATISAATPTFDGYVAESTNVRLDLNQAAFDTWLSAEGHPESSLTIGLKCWGNSPCTAVGPITPTSVFFGVGLGGAGVALYRNAFITGVTSAKEIVQNEPLSLLLELGLVGIALIILGLVVSFGAGSHFWRHPARPLLVALIIAYVITLNFFSGFANALQIYLLPPLLYLVFNNKQKVLAKNKTL